MAFNDADVFNSNGTRRKELLIGGTTHVALKGAGGDVIVVDASKHPEILFEGTPDYDRWKIRSIR